MKFIELTGTLENYWEAQTFHVCVDHVLYICNYKDSSIVRVGTEDLHVQETPEEIRQRLLETT